MYFVFPPVFLLITSITISSITLLTSLAFSLSVNSIDIFNNVLKVNILNTVTLVPTLMSVPLILLIASLNSFNSLPLSTLYPFFSSSSLLFSTHLSIVLTSTLKYCAT